jgi:hypothetical protein
MTKRGTLTAGLLSVGSIAAALLIAGCSTEMPSAPSPAPSGATTPASTPPTGATATSARYRVTFEGTWSAATHPVDFPSSPHFSPLVGGTHNLAVAFWREGLTASAGIKDMAERGRTMPLDQEVAAAIVAGTAERLLVGGPVDRSPGSVSLEFEISQTHPLVTLVSMIAPSPDWFVGVSALPLLENGRWVDERQVDLVPWDAGTDSGSTFASADAVTTPPQAVARILSMPLSPGGRVTPLGTFTFTRIQS